jgi:hypothetical protein
MSSHQPPVTEQIDDPESGWTWFLSLASMIVFTVTVVAVAVLFFAFEDMEIEDKVIDVPAREVMSLRDEQNGLLDVYETYSVIPMGGTPEDAETRIRIPIEQAMEVQVAESMPDRADRTGIDRSSEVALLGDDQKNTPEAERR